MTLPDHDGNGQPPAELPLTRPLKDGKTVAQWLSKAQVRAAIGAEMIDSARQTGSRTDFATAERLLTQALSDLRTVRYGS